MHTTQTLAPQPRSTRLAGWEIPPKGHCTHHGNLLTRRSRRPQAQGRGLRPTPTPCGPLAGH